MASVYIEARCGHQESGAECANCVAAKGGRRYHINDRHTARMKKTARRGCPDYVALVDVQVLEVAATMEADGVSVVARPVRATPVCKSVLIGTRLLIETLGEAGRAT